VATLSNRDIIFISSIEWDFLWQAPQEIALRLAQNGNRVLYIENTGVRAPGLRDAGRVVRRVKRRADGIGSGGLREVAPGLHVYPPVVMPPFGPRWRRDINRHFLLPAVRRAAHRLGMRDPLIWTYLPTDTAADLIQLLRSPRGGVVYYCAADFSQLTPHVRQLRRSEREVIERSDVVFTICHDLAVHCARWSDSVHVFPYGVNLDAFPLEAHDEMNDAAAPTVNGEHRNVLRPRPEMQQLKSLSSPVIGYVGGLHRHVDVKMLEEMARARPLWSWVFVGSLDTPLGKLAELPNVYLFGQRAHPELADYIRQFDVCLVPYVKSTYTDTVVPVKINEYLAMGKPVVSTDIPTVCHFNTRHQVLITAPAQTPTFLRAIEGALNSPPDPSEIKRRREVAALGDWGERLRSMSEVIESSLRAKPGSGGK